jgi:ArsR family transcriptional regulator, arsenate/arsenite/antimonite-responsive transcriptional repressor
LNYYKEPDIKKQTFTNQEINYLANQLKVISEPKRLMLLEQIIQGIQCNCDLGKRLNMAPNLISHHLGVLREAGLVIMVRDSGDSRWVYYSINKKAIEALRDSLDVFFSDSRMQPRNISCGPQVESETSLSQSLSNQ